MPEDDDAPRAVIEPLADEEEDDEAAEVAADPYEEEAADPLLPALAPRAVIDPLCGCCGTVALFDTRRAAASAADAEAGTADAEVDVVVVDVPDMERAVADDGAPRADSEPPADADDEEKDE